MVRRQWRSFLCRVWRVVWRSELCVFVGEWRAVVISLAMRRRERMCSGMERLVVWFRSSVVVVSVKGCSCVLDWFIGDEPWGEGLPRRQCRRRGWRRGGLGLWTLLC